VRRSARQGPPSPLGQGLLRARRCWSRSIRDLENQIRGLLKNLGLVIGRAKFNVFAGWAEELIEDCPELIAMVGPPYPASCRVASSSIRRRQIPVANRAMMMIVTICITPCSATAKK
jgi:hypothetical protein